MQPKTNPARPRIVIFTHGAEETVVVSSAEPDRVRTYKVDKLAEGEIVDTNGAGDAFAGGFLAGYVLGKSLEECIAAGHKLASVSIGQVRKTYINTASVVLTLLQAGPRFRYPKAHIF